MSRTLDVNTQFFRYTLVGVISNLFIYLIYSFSTSLGMGPKTAMTILYIFGVLQTFIFNKRWTFNNKSRYGPVFIKYCTAYGIGYLANLLVLVLFVDQLHYSHLIVQGVTIIGLAVILFLLQKFWVFSIP